MLFDRNVGCAMLLPVLLSDLSSEGFKSMHFLKNNENATHITAL